MIQSSEAPPQAAGPGRLSARWFWLAFLGLYLLTALPIVRADLPPLVDYPNHLARMHVLIDQPRSAALQQYYEIRWRPMPNLAMDLTVPLLARIMPLDWAGKVFILIFLTLLPAGTALIHRVATGQWSVWPLFAFVFLYSHLLVWGSLNYLFGLGLALMAFALWLALAERAAVVRVGMASIAAFVLFFAHLMACAVFGLLIAGHEIGELWRARNFSAKRILARVASSGLPFVVPLAILVGSGRADDLGDFAYDGVLRKLGFLVIFEGHLVLDIVALVAIGLLIATAYRKRFVSLVPTLRAPFLLLVLAFVFAPATLMTAHGIDERFTLAFMLLLAAGTVSIGTTAHAVRVAVLVGVTIFLARTAALEIDCERANQVYSRLVEMLDQVPRGGRLAVAFRTSEIGPSAIPINHIPTLAVLRRDAFVPTLFTYELQQPITLTSTAWPLQAAAAPVALWTALMAGQDGDEQLRTALAGFDALVALDPWPFSAPSHSFLVPVGIEPKFALYRVVH